MSARFRGGGALARWAKRECLAQAGLEQSCRKQPAQPAQKSCSADRPSHAIGPFDRSQHFLGDDLRLGRRVGVVRDRRRRAAALACIGVDPFRLRSARVEVGLGIGWLDQDHADAERAHFVSFVVAFLPFLQHGEWCILSKAVLERECRISVQANGQPSCCRQARSHRPISFFGLRHLHIFDLQDRVPS